MILFNLLVSPPQPAGLRNRNAAAFASLKKSLRSFFNPPRRTEPKEAANPVTGERSVQWLQVV
ncbi:MAG: hypothetical protein ABIN67_22010 [Ferruginibacter sp.]